MDGTLVRMDQGRTVKEISENKLEGSMRRGRHRLRWLEFVEKNLQEMKFERLRQKAVDREEWVYVIREAKALRWL